MLLAMPFLTTAGGESEMDETFLVILAAGAREAGYRYRHLRSRSLKRSFGHRFGDLAADRAAILDHLAGQAEQIAFRAVRIGDEPAIEHVAVTRHIGKQRGEQSAGAAFCRRNLPVALLRGSEYALGKIADIVRQRGFKFLGHTVDVNVPAKPGVPATRSG